MYVCVCNAVTDQAIKQAVQQGHAGFEAIQCLEQGSENYLSCYAEVCA